MKVLNIIAFVVLGLSLLSIIVAVATPGWIVGSVTVNGKEENYEADLVNMYRNGEVLPYSEVEKGLRIWEQGLPEAIDLSGLKRNVDGAMAFMIFAVGATLASGIIFIIALKKESTILTSSAAHCSTFAALFIVIAISFYSASVGVFTLRHDISYGYSYGFAWFAMCVDVINGVLIAVIGHRLNKKKTIITDISYPESVKPETTFVVKP